MGWVDLELALISLAAMLSPTTLTFSVLAVVLAKRPLRTGVWFYLGAFTVTIAIGILAAFVLGDVAAPSSSGERKTWVSVFDLVDDGSMKEVEARRYKAIVLPGVRFVPEATRRFLADYARGGGVVIAVRRKPDGEWPSLPVVGFNYALALAGHADVTVFTHIRNRENVEKRPDLGFEIVYLDNEYIASPMYRFARWLRGGDELGWTIQIASNYLPYLEFERLALRRIRDDKTPFDLVHRITPMSPTLPSYAAGRTATPFLIGPLNGNLPWPREFAAEQRRERETLSKIKNVYKMLPFVRATYGKSAAILAAFPHTIASLDKRNAAKIFDVPEIGYDPATFYAEPRRRGDRLTFLRNLVHPQFELGELRLAEHRRLGVLQVIAQQRQPRRFVFDLLEHVVHQQGLVEGRRDLGHERLVTGSRVRLGLVRVIAVHGVPQLVRQCADVVVLAQIVQQHERVDVIGPAVRIRA